MASYPAVSPINGTYLQNFNTEYYTPQVLQSSQIATNNLVVSGSAQIQGTNAATEAYVNTKVNSAVESILGSSTLSLSTLQAIDAAINNDSQFAQHILSQIQTNQNNISTNLQSINTIASKQIADESNITALQLQQQKNITDISNNTINIATNTLDISANTANIATLFYDVSLNTLDISNNALSIQNLFGGVSSNLLQIQYNQGNIQTLFTDVSNIDASLNTINSEILTLQTDINSIDFSLNGINSEIVSIQNQQGIDVSNIAILFNDYNTQQGYINSLQTNISNLQTQQALDVSSINQLSSQQAKDVAYISALQGSVSTLQNQTTGITYDMSTNVTSFNSYLNGKTFTEVGGTFTLLNGLDVSAGTLTFPSQSISSTAINNTSFVDLASNQTILGTKNIPYLQTTTQAPNNNTTNVATTSYVDTAINNLIGGASYSTLQQLQNLVQTDASNILISLANNYVDISTNQLIDGYKTFTTGLATTAISLNGTDLQTTLTTDASNISQLKSQYTSLQNQQTLDVQNITTLKNNYTTLYNLESTDASNILVLQGDYNQLSSQVSALNSEYSTLNTTLTNYSYSNGTTTIGNIVNVPSHIYSANIDASNVVIDTSLSVPSTFTLNSTQINNTSFLPYSGGTITGSLNVNGGLYSNALTSVKQIQEYINNVTASSNTFTADFSTGSIFYVNSVTANLTCNITNIPITNSYESYTINLIIPAKFYATTISVNGTTISPIYNGGSANVSVSSAVIVLQSLTIIFTGTSTPSHILTSVSQLY